MFEAPDYSWYELSEEPVQYKVLQGTDPVSFDAVHGEVETLEGTAAFGYDRHTDLFIETNGADEVLEEQDVCAVLLTTDSGTTLGLRHLENFWRKTQFGMKLDSTVYEALKGQTLTQITWITRDHRYTMDISLFVPDDALQARLSGTYIELFPEFAKEEFHDYWMECLQTYIPDADEAEGMYQYLTQGFMGTLKGQEAIDAYSGDPSSMVFDCFFESMTGAFS